MEYHGQITNNVRLQDAKLQQLLVNYQNLVLTAQQQVDDAIARFLRSRIQAEDLRRSDRAGRRAKTVHAAQGTLNIAMDQYEQGAADFTLLWITLPHMPDMWSWLDAQATARRARTHAVSKAHKVAL